MGSTLRFLEVLQRLEMQIFLQLVQTLNDLGFILKGLECGGEALQQAGLA